MSFKDLIKGLPAVRPSLLVSIDLNRLRQMPPRDQLNELEAKRKRVQQALLVAAKQKPSKDNNLAKTKSHVRFQTPAMRKVVAARAKIASPYRVMLGGTVLKPAIVRQAEPTDQPNPLTDRLVRPPLPVLPKPKPGVMRHLPSREWPNDMTTKRKREEDAPETLAVKQRFKGSNSKEVIWLPQVLSLEEINVLEAKRKRWR
ncbi:Uncharacterized protein APZ42_004867 [Daphnia magna]|uniref:Uncharacterized protein n=1 Tax=Daphnia magna TaxID=35525 RepID=A0A162EZR0_9CRUS|nr:Uncharacterized protein APZ42_004867 [Daphnia magna]